jgi:hypothetical protein
LAPARTGLRRTSIFFARARTFDFALAMTAPPLLLAVMLHPGHTGGKPGAGLFCRAPPCHHCGGGIADEGDPIS